MSCGVSCANLETIGISTKKCLVWCLVCVSWGVLRRIYVPWKWGRKDIFTSVCKVAKESKKNHQKNQKRTTIKPVKSVFLGDEGTKKEPIKEPVK